MAAGRLTPRQSIAAECRRRGAPGVVSGCINLLEAREADDALVLALGGEAAPYVLSGGEGGTQATGRGCGPPAGRHRAARRPGRAGPLGRGPGHRPADGQRALS
jgi:hypothetical protein